MTEPRLPRGYWPEEKVRAILDKTLTVELEADLAGLSPGEQRALADLLAVARLFRGLQADMNHHQALRARRDLAKLHESLGRPRRTRDLQLLDELFLGPIATTLDNELVPFLPVDGRT